MNTWIVTGATRGLGRALAESLATLGNTVAFCARTPSEVRSAEKQLSARGDVWGKAGSIDDPEFVAQFAAEVERRASPVRGLVLNAAILGDPPLASVLQLTSADLQQVLAVNLAGNLMLLQAIHPLLQESGGSVIAVTSDAAWQAYPGWASYGASKAALELLLSTYRAENPGIQVHLVDPGDMDTAMHRRALPDETERLRDPRAVASALRTLWREGRCSGHWVLVDNDRELRLQEVTTSGPVIALH